MFTLRRSRDRYGLSTPVLAILATFMIAIVVTCLSLLRTAGETNIADNQRTALSVANAIDGQVDALVGIAEDNAYWDSAAAWILTDTKTERFALANWGDSSRSGINYDCVVALDQRGRIRFMISDGRIIHAARGRLASPSLMHLVSNIRPGATTKGGIMRGSEGVRLAAAGLVRSSTKPNPSDPVYLVLSKRLTSDMLQRTSERLVISDLQLTAHPGSSSIALRDPTGDTIGYLGWQASKPGNQALWRSLPFFGLAFIAGMLAIALLMTRTIAAMRELNRIALIDSLSGLPNRRALSQATKASLRRGQSTAVAFIDLDGFKSVNDSYGHAVGDELIRQCAAIAKELRPQGGMVARLGGDEFAILACGARADDDLCTSVDGLLERLQQTFRIGERSMSIGASIGLSSSTLGADRVSELMRQADIAMYAAKRSGKMRRLWFTPEMDRNQALARTIEVRLKDALDADEFEVHYQPIIDARTGEVASVEGLLRWDRQGMAEIGPDRFIPVAEETGLIDRLGQFVMRRACRDAAGWPTRLSVNVSSAQLRNPEFPRQLKHLLDQSGFPADRLELEVTETYVVLDPVMAGKVLSGIRELGVRLALDDFGTGYASIGFLRQFAFDTLKIDKTLIADAIHDSGARAMLHASIAVARALNMTTVAEGIENEAQAQFMRAAGCDYLQGWLFSRAVDAHAIGAYLTEPRDQNGDGLRLSA